MRSAPASPPIARARLALVALLCVTLALTGCTTLKPVALPAGGPATAVLSPGDQVRVWMKDGRVLDLRLSAVEADALVSGPQRLPLTDIERVERLGVNWSSTAYVLYAIAVVALAIIGINSVRSHHP